MPASETAEPAPFRRWHAFLLIDGDDFTALDQAGPHSAGRHGYILHHVEGDARRGVLVVWVSADCPETAMTKAAETYVMMRSRAELEWRDPRIVAAHDDASDLALHDRLILDAAELIAERRYELVVLRVQTAAELAAERCYIRLIAPKLTPKQQRKAPRLLSRTLADDRSRNLFEAITGLRPDHEPWWDLYTQHLNRRNAVVHTGQPVTQDQAERSVSAALSFVSYMEADGRSPEPLSEAT